MPEQASRAEAEVSQPCNPGATRWAGAWIRSKTTPRRPIEHQAEARGDQSALQFGPRCKSVNSWLVWLTAKEGPRKWAFSWYAGIVWA